MHIERPSKKLRLPSEVKMSSSTCKQYWYVLGFAPVFVAAFVMLTGNHYDSGWFLSGTYYCQSITITIIAD